MADPSTADAVTQAIMRGAAMFSEGREIAVDNHYDEATGRAVCRVADRQTGEVLFESPPEPLLRFFASMREPPGAPLVALDA